MLLKKGSTGTEVTQWQEFLVLQGHAHVTPDGDFGPKTSQATFAFQKKHLGVLFADSKVGPKTLAKAVELGFKGFAGQPNSIKKPVDGPSESHAAVFKTGDELDKRNMAMLSRVHPELQKRVLAFLDAAKKDGVRIQIVQSLRTFAQQSELYAQGRTKPGKRVTNAKAGQSNHNFGTAVDAAPVIDGKVSWDEKRFASFGKWAAVARLAWGGNWKKFKDLPHLELPNTPNPSTLLGWYRQGGLAEVWENVD